jgi:hypothetical protein
LIINYFDIQYSLFIIRYSLKRGYPDIFLERMANKPLTFDIVLELKYVKKSAVNTIDNVIKETETQLDGYMKSDRFSRPDVRGFYVVFLGGDAHKWGEYGKY